MDKFQEDRDYEANAPYDYMSEAYGNQVDAAYEAYCDNRDAEEEEGVMAHVHAYRHHEWLVKAQAEFLA